MSAPHLVAVVFGTRPEAIKLAPVILALRNDARFQLLCVSTGQHEAILDWVYRTFAIHPDVNLGIHAPGNSLADICIKTMAGLQEVLIHRAPDVVVVQGDTSAAMTAAMTAFNLQIPVVHVEAGLRTGDLSSPFPEEMNRRVIAQVASLHLTPTPTASNNLIREGHSAATIVCTGNTIVDALQMAPAGSRTPVPGGSVSELVLVTTHRRESWGAPLEGVVLGIERLAASRPETHFFVAMHPNPAVQAAWASAGRYPNITLSNSVEYGVMLELIRRAKIVVTDSGGLQEEAPSFGRPVLVLRDYTERTEGIESGSAKLVGTSADVIYREVLALLQDPQAYALMSSPVNPYGDGRAAERCVAALSALLGSGQRLPDYLGSPSMGKEP